MSFHSKEKSLQNLLSSEEVKEDMRGLVNDGINLDIERRNGDFDFRASYTDESKHNFRVMIPTGSKGIKMLKRGMRKLNSEKTGLGFDLHYGDIDYFNLAKIALYGGVIGAAAVGGVRQIESILAEQTYAQIQKAALFGAFEGLKYGTGVGLLADAGIVGKKLYDGYVKTPLERINFIEKIRKSVDE